jgi:3',5'-cyclic AMP phosphodiesterase CpdA
VIDGLEPGTTVEITVDGDAVARATTLTPPPGRLLSRIATISDLHVGETSFGRLPRSTSSADPAAAHPMVCTRAALYELREWGAELLVVKGDIAHANREAEYDLAGALLANAGLAIMVLPGNHDGGNHRGHDPATTLARYGIDLVQSVAAVDVPGLRVVGVDTRTSKQIGTVTRTTGAVLDAIGTAGGGALITLHHQLTTAPFPTYPPPGVPAKDSRHFLDAVAATNPDVVVTTGHTHRHRHRHHGPVLITEVGSTKDYPGTWAGYLVYEGGIVQTVRRVMAPDAIRWTEQTGRMFGGAWSRWSPGQLSDRSISHAWGNRAAEGA